MLNRAAAALCVLVLRCAPSLDSDGSLGDNALGPPLLNPLRPPTRCTGQLGRIQLLHGDFVSLLLYSKLGPNTLILLPVARI